MQRLFTETLIAAAIFALLSFLLRIGMVEGDGWGVAALNAVVFGVFYFIIGLAVRFFKGRKP